MMKLKGEPRRITDLESTTFKLKVRLNKHLTGPLLKVIGKVEPDFAEYFRLTRCCINTRRA